ncbi:hypothetical protein [Mucilaginibacter aquariorum]|uniref:Uncharacterized protein n=1 Tax=Mucilaginibacter aquariorum TaxID=2967225 RepID=A0ABT1SXP8_9SPHI|nr:hypothetical protein [Mucilaginibacter aquariorum]MCQ6957042.1 hypothetical protein [Mucilaginibacter aquariorum]
MLTIYHHQDDKDVRAWKDRLDQLFVKYEFIEQENNEIPKLQDSDKQVNGKEAIDTYLDGLEQFVKGWYEDRCDKYDFEPER